jgi:hypothetical protein
MRTRTAENWSAAILRHLRKNVRTASATHRLLNDKRGNALMIFGAFLPLVVGAAGLAVDTTEWVYQKRNLQAAADGAAIAGSYGAIADQDINGAATESFSNNDKLSADVSIQITPSPASRPDDPFAVHVSLAAPAKLTFSSLFLSKPPVILAEATASAVEIGQYCAFALGKNEESGVVIKAGSVVELGCGIASNSTGAKSFVAEVSSNLKAQSILARGAIDGTNQIEESRTRSYALTQKDPLADTDPPLIPNTGCPNVTVNPGTGVDLAPGCYGNMNLNGLVRLHDGEYVLNKGDFVIGPQGEVTCDACTIFLTSETANVDGGSIGKVNISSVASVKLSATREGPNDGILIYQDRHAARDIPGQENRIGGNSFSKYSGLIYFPSETVYVDGAMSPDFGCARLTARRLVFAGHVYIMKSCSGLDHVTFAATEVKLVE